MKHIQVRLCLDLQTKLLFLSCTFHSAQRTQIKNKILFCISGTLVSFFERSTAVLSFSITTLTKPSLDSSRLGKFIAGGPGKVHNGEETPNFPQ